MAPLILLSLIALPFVEIAGFIIVGDWIGVVPTLGLLVLAMLLGVALVRGRGLAALARSRQAANPVHVLNDLGDTLFLALAGVLLLIPGFVTDVLALPLLLPPVRQGLMVLALRRLTVVAAGVQAPPAGMGADDFAAARSSPQSPAYGSGPEIDGEYRDVTVQPVSRQVPPPADDRL